MVRKFQCLKCGSIFRSKREIVQHLRFEEKVDELVIDSYYISFIPQRWWYI